MDYIERQPLESHGRSCEPNEFPAPEQAGECGIEPANYLNEDLTAGSEGGGRTIGLGGSADGAAARPMREGH
jgi:hypothetical protein